MKNKPFTETLQEAFQKTWTDAVRRWSSLEDELARRYRAAAERADIPLSSEELQRLVADMRRRIQQNSELMERRFEEQLRGVTERIRPAMTEELARLRAQAEQLAQRIDSQLSRKRRRGGDDADGAETDTSPQETPDETPRQ